MSRRRLLATAVLLLAVAAPTRVEAAAPDGRGPSSTAPDTSWSAYLHGPRHSSSSTSTAITVARAGRLKPAWTWQAVPKPGVETNLNASPVTAGGTVYVSAGTGDLYALDEATGAVRWRKVIAPSPCGRRGSTSTPTVTADPVSGLLTEYVLGADNRVYALDPRTGRTRWRTVHGGLGEGFYAWGSPTVANGKVYVSVSASSCAMFSAGGAAVYDQHTGALLGTYRTATGGEIPNVYTSPLVDGTDVYVTTGDGTQGDNDSFVRLSADTLARRDAYEIPSPTENSDFNASPAFFTATLGGVKTSLVGACNKDGTYYAMRAGDLASGPVWTRKVGLNSQAQPETLRFCGGSSAYDSRRDALLLGSNQRSLSDKALGSVYSLVPATGAVRWRTSLPAGPVIGSLSVNAAGVVAVPTYDASKRVGTVALLDEGTGRVLATLPADGPVFAQPTFSGPRLLVAAGKQLTAYAP